MPQETGSPDQDSRTNHAEHAPDSDVEAEIRRQIMRSALPLSIRQDFNPARYHRPQHRMESACIPWTQTHLLACCIAGKNAGGILAGLASIIALLVKLKTFLVAFKFFGVLKTLLITGGSMFVSMWAYASAYGWGFGVAMVLMIFIHECGHAFAGHLRGKPWGIMMFIPFMGAFVTIRGGKDAVEDAFIGIAGPIVGTAAGLVTVLLTQSLRTLSGLPSRPGAS
jgi:hypothetical protein